MYLTDKEKQIVQEGDSFLMENDPLKTLKGNEQWNFSEAKDNTNHNYMQSQ